MTDTKKAIETLSNQANYSHCPDPPVPTIKLGYKAGKALAELIERLLRERDWAVQNVARHCATCKHSLFVPNKGACESYFETDCDLGDVDCIETINGPDKWECRLSCDASTEGAGHD